MNHFEWSARRERARLGVGQEKAAAVRGVTEADNAGYSAPVMAVSHAEQNLR
jgi:hypothetical protein